MTLSNEIKRVANLNTNVIPQPVPSQSGLLDSPELERSILALLGMLYPMAPHFVSEVWEIWRKEVDSSLSLTPLWPVYDEAVDKVNPIMTSQTIVVAVCLLCVNY